MNLKWYGTATILLEQDGTQVLFDPFLSRNEKGYKPPVDDLSAVNNILVTHGHLDHIADIPAILKHGDGKAVVYCTKTPYATLMSKGVAGKQLHLIIPGDLLDFQPFRIRVLKGKHIDFDMWLLAKKLINPRNIVYREKLRYMSKENKICTEAGETVIYEIESQNERVLLMGSCNLDGTTAYPTGADLLVLPLQGRTDIAKYAVSIVERLKPKRVLLDHFDDSFPPISSSVRIGQFIALMNMIAPDIPVEYLQPGETWTPAES